MARSGSGERGGRIARLFADPQRGVLRSAADALVAIGTRGAESDHGRPCEAVELGGWLLVVPGGRAGRLLLHALTREANQRGLGLEPPLLATPGTLFEMALRPLPDAPLVATPLERRLAWERALLSADPVATTPFRPRGSVGASLEAQIGPRHWRQLATTAVRLEDDLAAADRTMHDAIDAVTRRGGDPARLLALASLRTAVDALLTSVGRELPERARQRLLEQGELAFDRVILVGALELAAPQRRLLERMLEVIAIVPARSERTECFDALGCATARWGSAELRVPDEAVVTAERPRDLAELAMRHVASIADGERIAADEVVIGLADDALAPALQIAGHDAGVEIHVAAGVALPATPIGRLLHAANAYRKSRAPSDAAVLLRRPVIESLLEGERVESAEPSRSADPVGALDTVRSERLPLTLDGELVGGERGSGRLREAGDVVRAAIDRVDAWVERLASAESMEVALDELPWPASALGGGSDERLDAAGTAVRAIARTILSLPSELLGEDDVLDLLCEESARASVPGAPRERAIEAIGWLELLFEPAPHIAVLGMNEGAIPSGSAGDTLVPESLREELGMSCRASRAWRDAAILDCLLARAEPPLLVVGRRSEEGDPLVPSRLLLRDRGDALAKRVLALSDPRAALSGARAWRRASAERTSFIVPVPPPEMRLTESMSATDFRVYLASGVHFWLERIEQLATVNDDPREIPIPDLGTLVHGALQRLKLEQADDATDPDVVHDLLRAWFREAVRAQYGTRPLPAVLLQCEVMERRLEPLARWQAAHAAAGWRIAEVEWSLPTTFVIAPSGVAPMRIRGRVDRIDWHAGLRRWRIIDYKTSDAGKSPRDTHIAGRAKRWIDLQLPLYLIGAREALRSRMPGSSIEIGYVRIPASSADVGWCDAAFDETEIASALSKAEEIVTAIRNGEFPIGASLGVEDPLAGILQTAVFGRESESTDDDDDEGGDSAEGRS
jgi:ATP-dependent helicase/nuclease subunit B